MLFSSLSSQLAELPLHAQLMFGIVVGSGLACLAVVIAGALHQWRLRAERRAAGLGPLPPPLPFFPRALDQVYTALFVLFLLWSAGGGVLSAAVAESSPEMVPMNWATLVMAVIIHVGMYMPMLVRYAIVHTWQRPARPWPHYIGLPLFVWFCIYAAVMVLELSGFSTWFIEVTGCPEHQDVVLLFSRGDIVQRAYVAIGAVLVAPVVEECCFRGFLYNTLKRWGGCVAATLASALLFGAIHASLAQMIPLTIFGIAQCIAYEKVRSLWLPIAVHMLFNTTSLLATLLLLP